MSTTERDDAHDGEHHSQDEESAADPSKGPQVMHAGRDIVINNYGGSVGAAGTASMPPAVDEPPPASGWLRRVAAWFGL